jgi:hypothetical protein
MAVTVYTDDPKHLLSELKKAIQEKKIVTWRVDEDGDFTHEPEQWRYKAWLRPSIRDGKLVFTTIKRKDEKTSRLVYAIYHGRFIEMLLTHFDEKFERAEASALPSDSDSV